MLLVMEYEVKILEEKERLLGKTFIKLINKYIIIVGYLFCVNYFRIGLLLI